MIRINKTIVLHEIGFLLKRSMVLFIYMVVVYLFIYMVVVYLY
jgi:hypothetical protein